MLNIAMNSFLNVKFRLGLEWIDKESRIRELSKCKKKGKFGFRSDSKFK